MSGPVPSPRMKGRTGLSGTVSLPPLIEILPPAGGVMSLYAMIALPHRRQLERRHLTLGELRLHLRNDIFHGQTIFLAQIFDVRSMFDELVRPADLNHRSGDPFFAIQFQHSAAVTAH